MPVSAGTEPSRYVADQKPAAPIMASRPLFVSAWRFVLSSSAERASYESALAQLRRSHKAYARTAATASAGWKARLLGQLNGDLTRVRQTACHPGVVNTARPRGAAAQMRLEPCADAPVRPRRASDA